MRQLLHTAIACLAVGALTAPVHLGFLLLLVAPLLAAFSAPSAYGAWKQAKTRKMLVVKACMWGSTICAISLLHVYYFNAARAAANETAQAVLSFKIKNGRFPTELNELGNDAIVRAKAWHVVYGRKEEKPVLFYLATFIIFDKYIYNFSSGTWGYLG